MPEIFTFMAMEWDVEKANAILDAELIQASLNGKGVFDITTTFDPQHTFASMRTWIGRHPSTRPVDMKRPCIAVILPDFKCIIDGWGRIEEAVKRGLDSFPVFTLTPAEELRCRANPDCPVWKKIDAAKADSKYVAEWITIEGSSSPMLARIQRETMQRIAGAEGAEPL